MISISIVAGLTLMASFLCSLFEAALYALSPSQVEVLRERGGRGARRLARLREEVDEPIAAILTVNTIAHTVGAAWCGAMVGQHFGSAAVGVFAAAFTVLVLALTEIVPKSLGVRFAGSIGPHIAAPIELMIWATWPIVRLATALMKRMTGPAGPHIPSEEEVLVLSRLAARGGAVRPDEHRWVRNALRLDRVRAGELRTPRTVVETLDGDVPIRNLVDHVEAWVHSRVPVIENGEADRVIGLVHRREVLDAALRTGPESLKVRDLLRPIPFVPESMPAHELLEFFIGERIHMAAVANEHGGFEGVVTLEDVLECLLGSEIVDEHDKVENMRALARERSERRGSAPPGFELQGSH